MSILIPVFPFPYPVYLPDPGIEPRSLPLQADSLMSKPRYIYIFKDFLKIQLHAVNYMSRVEFMFWGVIVWIWAPRANAPRLTFIDIMAGDASRVSHCILSHPVSVESISCHLSAILHFPQILITTNSSIGLNVTIQKCAITFPHYWSHKLILVQLRTKLNSSSSSKGPVWSFS